MSLRERLLALADGAPDYCDVPRDRDLALAAARMALEDAARECSTLPDWCDWEHYVAKIRALAEGLDK